MVYKNDKNIFTDEQKKHLITGISFFALLILVTFTWPAINSIVWSSMDQSGTANFVKDYEFFLKLSWPYMIFATLIISGLWHIFKKIAP